MRGFWQEQRENLNGAMQLENFFCPDEFLYSIRRDNPYFLSILF
jgi:hypothetical protein